jgi:RNA polymerase sigma factor (sigma-70 family)
MLGSVHDAEDALQEALLRAWRGLAGFEGRSSVRSWLYSIVTNTALDITRHRSRRELPVDFGPAAGQADRLGASVNSALQRARAAVRGGLTLEGDKIRSVVGFLTAAHEDARAWAAAAEVFVRFGLPAEPP